MDCVARAIPDLSRFEHNLDPDHLETGQAARPSQEQEFRGSNKSTLYRKSFLLLLDPTGVPGSGYQDTDKGAYRNFTDVWKVSFHFPNR